MNKNKFIVVRINEYAKKEAADKIRKKYKISLSRFLRIKLTEIILEGGAK